MSKVKCECEGWSEECEQGNMSLLSIARRFAIEYVSSADVYDIMLPEDLPVTITYEGNPEPQTVVVRVELMARVLNPRGE